MGMLKLSKSYGRRAGKNRECACPAWQVRFLRVTSWRYYNSRDLQYSFNSKAIEGKQLIGKFGARLLALVLLNTTIVVVCSSAYRFHSRIRVRFRKVTFMFILSHLLCRAGQNYSRAGRN